MKKYESLQKAFDRMQADWLKRIEEGETPSNEDLGVLPPPVPKTGASYAEHRSFVRWKKQKENKKYYKQYKEWKKYWKKDKETRETQEEPEKPKKFPLTEYSKRFKMKMRSYVDGLKLEWPDYEPWDALNPRGLPQHKNYVTEHLANSWNYPMDLVIAVGHGNWIKRLVSRNSVHRKHIHLGHAGVKGLVHHRYVWGLMMADEGRQLDFTEFILLKWENKKGKLRITDLIRPGQTWYRLGKLMKLMGVPDPADAKKVDESYLARYADFGDNFGSDYYEDGYDDDFGFDDGGDYDDEEFYDDQDYDFGYYDDGEYGYDDDEQYAYDQYEDEQYDYDEDYDYDQSDDDAYSLYEQAAINLKKAKEEFRIAQQLRKWKGVKGPRDYN